MDGDNRGPSWLNIAEVREACGVPSQIRFHERGKWQVSRSWIDNGQDLPDSVFKLHVLVDNALDMIRYPIPWPNEDFAYDHFLWIYKRDLWLLGDITDQGWRLLDDWREVLSRAAGGVVQACGEVAVCAHELVLRLGDRVLIEACDRACDFIPASIRGHAKWSGFFLAMHTEKLKAEDIPAEFDAVSKRLSFLVKAELVRLEAQVQSEYLRAKLDVPPAVAVPGSQVPGGSVGQQHTGGSQSDKKDDAGQAPALTAEHHNRKQPRPAYKRDHFWLKWSEEDGMTPSAIRDRWNGMSDEERRAICPTKWQRIASEAGAEGNRDVLKKALRRAKAERDKEQAGEN